MERIRPQGSLKNRVSTTLLKEAPGLTPPIGNVRCQLGLANDSSQNRGSLFWPDLIRRPFSWVPLTGPLSGLPIGAHVALGFPVGLVY